MPAASLPADESSRLHAVRALGLVDQPSTPEFDAMADAAALVCETPLSYLNLVDDDRVFALASTGGEIAPIQPRALSFCPHLLLEDGIVEVADATRDARFSDNPYVTGAPGVRFYAGVPLRLDDGQAVGTLCVVDFKPRILTAHQRQILAHLGQTAVASLQARRASRAADQARAELLESQAHWQAIVENLHEGFIVGEVVRDGAGRGVDWRYVDVNDAWGRLVGVEADSARGRTVREVFPGIEQSWIDQAVSVVDTGHGMVFEGAVGRLGRWYEGRIHATGADRFVISFSEITEAKLAQRRSAGLLALSDQLQRIDEPATMSALAARVLGETLGVATAGYATLQEAERVDIDAVWTRPGTAPVAGAHSLTEYGDFMGLLSRGESLVVDDVATDPRTRSYLAQWEKLGMRAVINVPVLEGGRLVAIFFALDDAPRAWHGADDALMQEFAGRTRVAVERRRAELTLQEMTTSLGRQKLEAVGQLTGGVAHDFNNLLGTIKNSLEIIRGLGTRPDPASLERFCQMAMRSVERAAGLTQRLLAFSRKQTLTFAATDVNALVEELREVGQRLLGTHATLQVKTDPALPPAHIDATQLKSAIVNLVENARDAMAEGGQLAIETSSLEVGAAGVVGASGLAPGHYVVLSVTDDGAGMPPAVLAKAFDPFFTTKAMGQGAGLGLSMIYGFAQQSGGTATIFSREGAGTSVKLFLPRAGGALAPDAAPAAPAAEVDGQGRRILVVEDEEDLRAIVVELLTAKGFRVSDAGSAEEALQRLRTGLGIDVLVTDIRLPGMNGRVLAQEARQLHAALPVLMMTGYDTRTAAPHDVLEERTVLLTKPFPIERLAAEVVQLAAGVPG